jgi:hypothetical protein
VLSEFRATLRKEIKQAVAEVQRTFDEKLAALELRLKSVPGRLPPVKVWRPETVVYEGEIASYEGSLYQARKDSAQTPGGSDYVCVARAGRDDRDALTLNIRGTLDAYETYKQLDIVACDGASFVATRDDPGLCPGENWQLLSRQGRPGRRGERGWPTRYPGQTRRSRRGDPGVESRACCISRYSIFIQRTNGAGALRETRAQRSTNASFPQPVQDTLHARLFPPDLKEHR